MTEIQIPIKYININRRKLNFIFLKKYPKQLSAEHTTKVFVIVLPYIYNKLVNEL